jgi:hypothetical protein
MSTTPYPLRISDEILSLSKMRAQDEHVDQSTALRQLLYLGAEEYLLKLVAEGRISIGRAAEIINKSVYDLQRIAKTHGIEIGATAQQVEKSRKTAKSIFA